MIFPVQPHNLLMARPGDDARLLNGLIAAVGNHPRRGSSHPAQLLEHPRSRGITADDPACRHPPAEAANVMDHVGSASEANAFGSHAQHRHRSFRRDPLDVAPDEPVQHEIADNQQLLFREFGHDFKKCFHRPSIARTASCRAAQHGVIALLIVFGHLFHRKPFPHARGALLSKGGAQPFIFQEFCQRCGERTRVGRRN
jgi:hypothetical protein